MAVRSFMSIVEAHEKAKSHAQRIREGEATVFQSRQHAPPAPSFNGRGNSLRHDVAFAGYMASQGIITPAQVYDAALDRDIG